jgi:two-component system, sporulation sensor kinase A
VERIELITGELLLLAKPSLKTAQAIDLCEIINQVSPLLETQGMMNNVQIVRDYQVSHIIDQGPGIPFDQMSRIGQPFFSTKPNGTGLGLVVTYKIIQNHGGSITVANLPDEGAAFTIKLPCVVQIKLNS